MKKFSLSLFLFALIWIGATGSAYAFSGSGAGTEGDPYEITTCEQLQEMNDDLDADYELVNDIDCSMTNPDDPDFDALGTWADEAGFEPVGTSGNPFTGTLHGNENSITDLFINRATAQEVGLFGSVEGSIIQDITLQDVDITGGSIMGALVGYATSAAGVTISNAHASGEIIGDNGVAAPNFVGGLVGIFETGTIEDSHTSVNVTIPESGGGQSFAGFIGDTGTSGAGNVTISESYATGDIHVSGTSDGVGGFIGYCYDCVISESYATGDVIFDSSPGAAGGFIGGIVGGVEPVSIINAYATGDIIIEPIVTSSTIGGLIGLIPVDGVTVENSYSIGAVPDVTDGVYGGLIGSILGGGTSVVTSSYWDTQTSGQEDSGGGTGKLTTEMKQQGTFTDWDFSTIWGISPDVNNGYPFLLALTDPVVESVSPEDGAEDVPVDTDIIITFSEPMSTEFEVSSSPCDETCPTYDAEWSVGDTVLTLTKSNGDFEYATEYTIEFAAEDADGNEMADDYEWSFTTIAGDEDNDEEEEDSERPSSHRSGSGTRFGCKDSTATNYTRFARHKQELCEYASTVTPIAPTTLISYAFTRDLKLGMTGDDVNQLQTYLITQNKGPAALVIKNHGTTNYFGKLTQAALAEYQKSVGISPAVGFFGPVTRNLVNN